MSTLQFLIIIMFLYLLYRFVFTSIGRLEKKLNRMDSNRRHKDGYQSLREIIFEIKNLSAPLFLLNIFYNDINSTSGTKNLDLQNMVRDYEISEREHIERLKLARNLEAKELNEFIDSDKEGKFEPSKNLVEAIEDLARGKLLRSILYNNLDIMKQIYMNVLNGKYQIDHGRKLAQQKLDKVRTCDDEVVLIVDPRAKKEQKRMMKEYEITWGK